MAVTEYKKKRSLPGKSKRIKSNSAADAVMKSAPARKFPIRVSPMLATLVDQPVDRPGWSYEIKWDGYRALAFIKDGDVELKSRNDKSFNKKFYPVYNALKKWNVQAIVDGEIVALRENGLSDFGTLQNWRSEADGDLLYYVFDLLWLEGRDLRQLPLRDRRAVLTPVIPSSGIIRLSEAFNTSGIEFFNAARQMGLEGILAKKEDSPYLTGARTVDWLKIKANRRQEVVIGGYTRNLDSSKAFSALLVGVYDHGKFIYTGKIGTGFKDLQQREMLKQFKPLITDKVPFSTLPDINKPSRFNPRPLKATATWLKPKLVCEVSFTEMTTDGVMRHPSFQGMRTDKNAKEVVKEESKKI